MSDQQQASGDSSARKAVAATPDADGVAARLTGAGEPPAASTPEGADAEKAAGNEAAAGADPQEGIRPPAGPKGRAASSVAGTAAVGPAGDAGHAEEASTGEKAGHTGTVEATAEKADSGDVKAGGEEEGNAGEARGEDTAGRAERNGARALSAAATTGQPRAAATAVSGGGATSSSESGVGRPRKPVLAGAAIAGALLIAVPLLITVADRDEEKKVVDTAAADTVLDEADDPAGVFVTQSPSPTRTKPKADPGKKQEKEKKEAGPASPAAEKAAAPVTVPSPSPSKKEEKKKAAVKKAPSSLPAVLTRVLIKNNTNRTCVDVPGFASGSANGPVTHATCNSNTDDNQLWNVEKRYDKAGPGGVPLFQIRNVMDSMCLDLPGYQGVGGATKVTEFPCDGTTRDNQLWWLDKQSDGTFWIRNAASNNQCLDSYGPDDDTRELIVWPCAPESQNNHEWTFTRS
jgi:hypothetical protein